MPAVLLLPLLEFRLLFAGEAQFPLSLGFSLEQAEGFRRREGLIARMSHGVEQRAFVV